MKNLKQISILLIGLFLILLSIKEPPIFSKEKKEVLAVEPEIEADISNILCELNEEEAKIILEKKNLESENIKLIKAVKILTKDVSKLKKEIEANQLDTTSIEVVTEPIVEDSTWQETPKKRGFIKRILNIK